MPTYEYKCKRCGHAFERFSTKILDESSVDCEKCGEEAERLISGGAGLLFKGSGFHITDYRNKSYRDAETKEAKPPQDTASVKGAGGSERKKSRPQGDSK